MSKNNEYVNSAVNNSGCSYQTLNRYNSNSTMAPSVQQPMSYTVPMWGQIGYDALTHGNNGNCSTYFNINSAYGSKSGSCSDYPSYQESACGGCGPVEPVVPGIQGWSCDNGQPKHCNLGVDPGCFNVSKDRACISLSGSKCVNGKARDCIMGADPDCMFLPSNSVCNTNTNIFGYKCENGKPVSCNLNKMGSGCIPLPNKNVTPVCFNPTGPTGPPSNMRSRNWQR